MSFHPCFSQDAYLWVTANVFVPTQVKERGGNCVPVICDSTKDKDIEELFERIKREQDGRLDILVNNAYAGVQVQNTVLY